MKTRGFFAHFLRLAAVLAVGLCLNAQAQIPRTLAYQGFLVTAAGQPVSATLSMTFRLYSAATGGSPLWSETLQVPVTSGSYTVSLGSVVPLTLAFDVPYYLGVTVGSDAEMTPRQALSSAPYALRAGCIPGDRLSCFSPGGSLPSGCQTGVRICNADGTGFGPCVGEVTPNCAGSCVNFQTDAANCGTCGNACAGLANAAPACAAGACALGACNSGFGNCDGLAGNGCETNLSTSTANCGTCGNACPSPTNASAACSAGSCGLGSCNAGFANCDGVAGNGCEVNVNTSTSNCGACGNICPSRSNATTTCSSGACSFACSGSFRDCDGSAANGCEVNIQTSLSHCGACGSVCSLPNASAACSAGVCSFAGCNAGFANCDGVIGNGCEVNLKTNSSNCGACGNACAGGQTCSNGACV